MARIAGVDIPNNKQVWVSLQYIYASVRRSAAGYWNRQVSPMMSGWATLAKTK